MLFAVSDDEVKSDSDSTTAVNVTTVLGQHATFPCYSAHTDVEWRSGPDRSLKLYTSGKILPLYASSFSVESAGGWHNLTTTVTSSNPQYFYCFEADGGSLLKEYRMKVVAGILLISVFTCVDQGHLQLCLLERNLT